MEVGRMSREILGRRARNFYGNNDDFSLCWCASDVEKGKFLKKNSIHRLFHIKTRMESWPFRLGLESKIRIRNGSWRRSRPYHIWNFLSHDLTIPGLIYYYNYHIWEFWVYSLTIPRLIVIDYHKYVEYCRPDEKRGKPIGGGGGRWDEKKPEKKNHTKIVGLFNQLIH